MGIGGFHCRSRGYVCCQHLQPPATKRKSARDNSDPAYVLTCFMGLVVRPAPGDEIGMTTPGEKGKGEPNKVPFP